MSPLKRISKAIVMLSIGLILILASGYLFFRYSFRRAQFNGLREQVNFALMKPIAKNLDGSPVGNIDSESAQVFSRAGEIGITAARRKSPLPLTSQDLSEIAPEKRVDPWGHHFCLADLGDRIAVISSGTNGSTTECSDLQRKVSTVKGMKSGFLYRSSNGDFVFVVPRT
jgi:hypothetical protein